MGAATKSDEIGTVGYSQFLFSDKTKIWKFLLCLSYIRVSHTHISQGKAMRDQQFVFTLPQHMSFINNSK